MPSLSSYVLALLVAPLAIANPAANKYPPAPKYHTVTVTKHHTVTKHSTVTVSACKSSGGSSPSSVKPSQPYTSLSVSRSSAGTSGGISVSRSTSVDSATTAPSAPASSPASSTSSSNPTPSTTLTATATGTKGLNDYAKAAGKKYFGTAADIPGTPELQDVAYMTQLNNTHDFGQITPANYLKWFATEPERNVFNFTGAEVLAKIAEANGQIWRCHTLLWHNQLPDWLTSGTWDNATLIEIMTNHITKVASYWGDRCYAWDVLNEAFEDNGTYRATLWYNTIGPAYIPIAFAAAEAAVSKNVRLYYNDYNLESPNNKTARIQQLVKDLKGQGIRIDGVGLQSHFIVGSSPTLAEQEQNIANFAALGVEVANTELDIRIPVMPPTEAQQLQQKADYLAVATACKNAAACVGMTLWDWDDTYSWIPGFFAGQGWGTPWVQAADGSKVKKIAYDGLVEGLTS